MILVRFKEIFKNSINSTFENSPNSTLLVAVFPIIFMLTLLYVYQFESDFPNIYWGLLREDGLFESLQWLCYFSSGLMGLYSFLTVMKLKPKLKIKPLTFQAIFLLLFSILSILIAIEEISWGQRIFGIESNNFFLMYNVQKETNAHNLNLFQENIQFFYIFIGLFGSFGWLFKRNCSANGFRDIFVVDWFLSLYFLPVALFYFYLHYSFIFNFLNSFAPNLFNQLHYHQEQFETLLSFGICLMAYFNLVKCRLLLVKNTGI